MVKYHIASNWRNEVKRLTRYAGSGVINTIIGFIVIFSAMALGISPMISNVAGYAVGLMLGFVFSKKFVFRSNGHFVTESVRYVVAFIISFLLNLLVLRIALIYSNYHVVASQVAAGASYTILMYVLARIYVFRGTRVPE
jgi:putative flippase GtrA